MITKSIHRYLAGISLSLLVAGTTPSAQAQTQFPSDVDTSQCDLTPSEFQSWITLTLPGTTTPIGPVYDPTSGIPYIFPVDGPSFVTNNSSSGMAPDNCAFYKWGAQMFLWLTSSVSDTASPVSNPTYPATLPFVFNSEFFYRLSANHDQLLAQGSLAGDSNEGLAIALRTAKQNLDGLGNAGQDEGIGQAGGLGVLLTQNSSPADASLTYYGVHVNRLYGYFRQKTKGVTPAPTNFPTTGTEVCTDIDYALNNGYAEDTTIAKLLYGIYCPAQPAPPADALAKRTSKQLKTAGFTTTSAFTIPELEPAVDFLSMAVEVKTSWVDAASVADKSNYIRQNIDVPTYDRTDPNHWFQTGSVNRELALVGMHVVGTVEGHPEMIWATIEHVDNAPDSTYYYMDKNGNVKTVSGPQAGSTWLYSNGTVEDGVTLHARGCDTTPYPMPAGCLTPTDIISVGDNEVMGPNGNDPIEPSNVTRLHPWGNKQSPTDTSTISQNTQLISLNRAVISNLKTTLASDPRQNYFISGAVWTSNGHIPSGDDFQYNTGSKLLSNTTMETFNQAFGCFGCHGSTPGNGVGESHIFGGITKDIPKVPTTSPHTGAREK